MITGEQLKIRNERRSLINKALPAVALLSFGVIGATGGKKNLQNIADSVDLGPGPPGVAEARALKAKSEAKSKAKLKEVMNGEQ